MSGKMGYMRRRSASIAFFISTLLIFLSVTAVCDTDTLPPLNWDWFAVEINKVTAVYDTDTLPPPVKPTITDKEKNDKKKQSRPPSPEEVIDEIDKIFGIGREETITFEQKIDTLVEDLEAVAPTPEPKEATEEKEQAGPKAEPETPTVPADTAPAEKESEKPAAAPSETKAAAPEPTPPAEEPPAEKKNVQESAKPAAPSAPPQTAAPAQQPPAAEKPSDTSELIVLPEQAAPAPATGTAAVPEDQKSKVEIKGYRYLKFRNYESSGNSGEFSSRAGLTNNSAKVEQGMNLTLSAKLGDRKELTGSFNEMPHQEREMVFGLGYGHYNTTYGDFTAKLEGGEFAGFSKRITGVQFGYETNRTTVSAVVSKSKSQTRTVQFTGRNIKGPYDLNARDLVPEKATVKLNNISLQPDQYVIDAFQGEITFSEIIGPNDIVTITYEQRLTGNLSAGGLTGMSFSRKSKNGNLTYGLTHLEQQADRQAQRLMESATEEISGETILASANGRTIEADNQFIVHYDAVSGSETITRRDYVTGVETLLEPNEDYNWQGEYAAYRIEELYAQGKFALKGVSQGGISFSASDTFFISYSYYPQNSVIQLKIDEEVSLDLQNQYVVLNPTIYSGSETLRICDTDSHDNCLLLLIRGTDYNVEERINLIIILIPPIINDNQYLRIDYWHYPDINSLQSSYDHTVDDFRLKYDVNESLSVEYERAVSESDLSSRPIPVINYTVMQATGTDLNCTDVALIKECTFSIGNADILPGTVVLYLNDRVSAEGVLTYSTNYTVDTNRGEVTLRINMPAGTVILADYQYTPETPSELQTGNRSTLKTSYNGDKTQVKFSLTAGDTKFSPIGGESNLETKRLSYGFSHKFSGNLTFSADWLNVDNAIDMFETHKLSSAQQRFSIQFSSKTIQSLSISYDTRSSTDDYNPAQTDNSDKKIAVNLSMPLAFLKNADIRVGYTKSDFNNNVGNGSTTTTGSRTLGFNYRPSRKLMLTTMLTVNEVDSQSQTLSFTSTNQSRQVGLKWTPIPMLMIGVDLDSQSTSDSRPNIAARNIQQTRMMISTRPFGKVKSIQISFMQQDSPSVSGPSSGTKSTSYSTGFILTKAISFNPSISISSSYVGDTSSTKTTSGRYELEFRPPGRPWHTTLGLQETKVANSNAARPTSSNNSNLNILAAYDPGPKWSYSVNYQKDSFSSDNSPGYDTSTFRTRIGRKAGEKSKQWFLYQKLSRSGGYDESSQTIELGTDNTLSKILSLNFLYRKSIFNNSNDPERNFKGNYLEGTLQATF